MKVHQGSISELQISVYKYTYIPSTRILTCFATVRNGNCHPVAFRIKASTVRRMTSDLEKGVLQPYEQKELRLFGKWSTEEPKLTGQDHFEIWQLPLESPCQKDDYDKAIQFLEEKKTTWLVKSNYVFRGTQLELKPSGPQKKRVQDLQKYPDPDIADIIGKHVPIRSPTNNGKVNVESKMPQMSHLVCQRTKLGSQWKRTRTPRRKELNLLF